MSFLRRTDFGTRVAGEKAQYKDEFITRSQLVAGRNVTITYNNSNYDIVINAIAGQAGKTAEGARQLQCLIRLSIKPSYVSGTIREGYKHKQIDTVGQIDQYERYYGTAYYVDIAHNWNLSDKELVMANVIDMNWGVLPANYATHSYPKVIPVNNNVVRVWGTMKGWSDHKEWLVTRHTGVSSTLIDVGKKLVYDNSTYVVVDVQAIDNTYQYVIDRINGGYNNLQGACTFEIVGGGSITITFGNNSMQLYNTNVGGHYNSDRDLFILGRTPLFIISLQEILQK